MKLLLLLCVIGLSSASYGGSGGGGRDTSGIKNKLERIVRNSGLKSGDVGIFIGTDPEHPLYELNSNKHYIPASITKLITAAAVMNAFQPNYKFHTQIWADGDQNGTSLSGNLYLKGGGDPAFVSEKMWMLVNDFLRAGIRKVSGNLVVDASYLDDEMVDPGREDSRNDRAYDAPVSGLSFNWNSTTIYVRPGTKAGEKALAWIDPDNEYVSLENEVVTSKNGTDLESSRKESKDTSKDLITVHGKIASGSEEKHIYKNITSPALYAGYNLKRFLKERGVEVSGQVTPGTVPSSARLAADEEGEPLSRLIADMDKFSNNFVAETLAKDLGAFKSGKQGHMADGLAEIRKFLTDELGWSAKDFNLANVSGFTRKNSFTPKQFAQLLSWVQRQFKIYPEYLQSLPIAGTDGTLQKRMKNPDTVGWVRAKTGLLTGVVALSGFAGRHDDGVYTFSFIYNGHADESHVREVFDSLASTLVK